ncbi:MAG: hypothetical protein GY822_12445 [Deltaproteobacteria bacterium]|nr:hypothetical protein [Deltaproteobacteria bacterium]
MTDPKTGKPVWSSIKRFQFLEKMVAETIAPKLSGQPIEKVETVETEFEAAPGDDEELPF